MEREKKSNVGLYICLVVLVFLVGIGTGYFLYKNKNKVEPTDILNTENAENSEKAITKSDAETILKDLYNAAVRHIFNESVSYCGDVDINDTGIILNDFHYYKSSSFKSFEELDNYLKNFMTESLLKNSNYNNSVVDEGIVIESYYEKNGSLYCNY